MNTIPGFLQDEGLELILFGGKGGVGKTTCASATALYIAKNNPAKSFLVISTDPAHSLMDSLAETAIPSNLKAVELDSQACLAAFKKKHEQKLREIALRGTFLDDADINKFLDLSLPGLDELMAFLEITVWVKEKSYACIVVDTAPTGHTLRLLEMPRLFRKWLEMLDALLGKHRYMKALFSRFRQSDDLDLFLAELGAAVNSMEVLLHSAACRFVPVMLAEALSIQETSVLLKKLTLPANEIIVNRIYPENNCPLCTDWRLRQMSELKTFQSGNLEKLWGVPLYPWEVLGETLIDYWENISEIKAPLIKPIAPECSVFPKQAVNPAAYPASGTKLLFFAGKGGVGKTTLACATALHLAHNSAGAEVLLFSTDPAHSLSDCLDIPVGCAPKRICSGLTAMEIDASQELEILKNEYQRELKNFLKALTPDMDITYDREVMERIFDLSPPGIDEIMSLTKIMEFIKNGQYDIFVFDSAPSGHLIRLLELPTLIEQWLAVFFGLFLKYKRIFRLPKITDRLVTISKDIKQWHALLGDPTQSGLYGVTILTEMAFQETKDLAAACKRMGVNLPGLFLNLATPANDCPLCSALFERETKIKKKFELSFPDKRQTLVYHQGYPIGLAPLRELGNVLYKPREKNLRAEKTHLHPAGVTYA
ncbi:MAG: ArsA family ATPase [Candidatus Schekmanbacteria bacterium]|nr:ArsA family ATPase [Candidatus Schekmanbacteria bacterium]